MTSAHVHIWTPVAGERAVYRCACSASGSRRDGGEIRAFRQPRPIAASPTARAITVWGGAVPARPGAP